MEPTKRALELAAPVHDGLALLERALVSAPFVAAESIRVFSIAAGDYVCALLLPRLVERLAQKAPHIELRILPVSRVDVGRQLDAGYVDLVVGWFDTLPGHLRRKPLLQETGALVMRSDHPLSREPLARERIFDYPHIVVDLTGAEETRGGFLDERGLTRRVWMERAVLQARGRGDVSARVAMTVPSFTAVPPLLRKSDLIATLPKRLALQAVAEGGLIMFDESLEHELVEVEVAWHSRSATDLGIAWLIDELTNAGAELDADA